MKANLAGFQCILYTSGEVATPASPIAPALESGAIVRKGTTVWIAFSSSESVWPKSLEVVNKATDNKIITGAIFFILVPLILLKYKYKTIFIPSYCVVIIK
jgi:hypothetical protein